MKDSTIEVLEGSHVDLKVVATMPVSLARVVAPDVPAVNVPVAADGKTMTLSFDMTKSIDFHLELTAAQGQSNRVDEDLFHLRTVEDRPPELRVLYPPSRLYRTATGVVPIKVVARDDFQVKKVSIEVLLGATSLSTAAVWPPEGAPPAATRRVDLYRPLDLLQFANDKGPLLKPQDVIHLRITAVDSHGNETTSSDLAVEVLSEEDLQRRLAQRQSSLREELQAVIRNQQRVRGAVTELGSAPKPPGRPSLDRGRDLQVDQGRVTSDLSQFLGGIHQVFDGYVLDRMGAPTAIVKLLLLYHEALARPSDEEVFSEELYARIVAEKRADKVYDPDILGQLLDIMDLGSRAVGELSPSVQKALASWTAEGPHPPDELATAARQSTELANVLAQIDLRMERWGDLNLLIEVARGIRDQQAELSRDPVGNKGLRPK